MRKKNRDNNRIKNVVFRMSEEEYGNLTDKAESTGISVSEFIRRAVTNKKIIYRTPIIHNDEELIKALYSVSKVATNLNQIAKYYNSGMHEAPDIRDEILRILGELRTICNKINREIEKEYGST